MMADIFNHLWQSTLFTAVVALLVLAFRCNRARLRYGLWFVASVKFLVPFAALAAVGSLVQWPQAPAPIRWVVASPAARDLNAPFAAMSLDPATIVAVPGPFQWIAPLLFGVWLCGFSAATGVSIDNLAEIATAVRASRRKRSRSLRTGGERNP